MHWRQPEDPSISDGELIARVRRGESDAFEILVRRHLGAALALAGRLLDEPADAEDACQDAFITVLQEIDQCRDPDRFRAWLLAILRNRCVRTYRVRKVHDKSISQAEWPSGGIESDPLADTWRSEIRDDVDAAMTGLTRLQRSVLVLHDLEGWKHADIGERLGISVGSSRVHLHAARRRMRRALGPRYAETMS